MKSSFNIRSGDHVRWQFERLQQELMENVQTEQIQCMICLIAFVKVKLFLCRRQKIVWKLLLISIPSIYKYVNIFQDRLLSVVKRIITFCMCFHFLSLLNDCFIFIKIICTKKITNFKTCQKNFFPPKTWQNLRNFSIEFSHTPKINHSSLQ